MNALATKASDVNQVFMGMKRDSSESEGRGIARSNRAIKLEKPFTDRRGL